MTRCLVIVVALFGCSSEKSQKPANEQPATAPAKAGSPAAPAAPLPAAVEEPPPKADAPSGEVFHATDRMGLQGFQSGHLAVGGGFVYWVEQPRIDKFGLGKSIVVRKPAADPGAKPEPVTEPGTVFHIAADAERLYIAGGGLRARPHAGGDIAQLSKEAWLQVFVGDQHLLVRHQRKLAIVPKAGGAAEVVWEGKRGNHHVAADGDRFLAIDVSSLLTDHTASRAITVYAPGQPPATVLEAPEVDRYLGIDGYHVYFTGDPKASPVGMPLYRADKTKGGPPQPIGSRDLRFSAFTLANGTLYGMVFTKAWDLYKYPLDATRLPILLDTLPKFSGMVNALATDDKHVYYLTDWDIKRAPL